MENNTTPTPEAIQPAAVSESECLQPSEFTGRTIQLIGWRLLGALLTIVTLGICGPWAYCMVLRWETNHTYIEGQRLHFDGRGHQLLGRSLLWGLLTVVTCGVYGLFVPVRWRKWRASYTRFATDEDEISNNGVLKVFGIILAGVAITALLVFGASLLTKYLTNIPAKQDTPASNPIQNEGFGNGQNITAHVIQNEDGTFTIIYEEVPNQDTEEDASWQKNSHIPHNIVGSWMSYSEDPLGIRVSTQRFYEDGTYTTFTDSYEYSSSYGWRASGLADTSSRGSYSYENGELVLLNEEYYVPPNESPDGEAYWVPSSNTVEKSYQITISYDANTLSFWKSGAVSFELLRVHNTPEEMLNALYPNGPEHELYG